MCLGSTHDGRIATPTGEGRCGRRCPVLAGLACRYDFRAAQGLLFLLNTMSLAIIRHPQYSMWLFRKSRGFYSDVLTKWIASSSFLISSLHANNK